MSKSQSNARTFSSRAPLGATLWAMLVGLLLPLMAAAQGAKNPDARAEERLAWMRVHEGDLWNVNHEEGKFLRDLARKVKAKRALELGTSNGYSSIWIALGLCQAGGQLITMEIDQGRAKLASENFRAAGVDSLITLTLGDARKEVPKLQGPFEFVFIDAWKQDYVNYLKMVLPMVPPGGVIVAHNVTNLREELLDYIHEVQTNPQLKTTIENPGSGGFAVSYKLPSK
jgi:predicted O-methyltransferase YrrM